MCGIAGKINFQKTGQVREDEIQKMLTCLAHRGPDGGGVWTEDNIGLGHRRLSIIDLSPAGKQPMSDNQDRYLIVFNGEIYNYLELKRELAAGGVVFKTQTDTEVLLELYIKHGPRALNRLRGMFAFAVWDRQKKELFLARDRVGKKPLKFYQNSSVFIFASEAKAILENPEVKKTLDWQAVEDYLTFQYVPGQKTGFINIQKLEPGYFLMVKPDGQVIKECYWKLKYQPKQNKTEAEWEHDIFKTLEDAVKLRMISDVPLGAHLSGGIDSGLITALMAKNSSSTIKTFSVGFKELDFSELEPARLTAKKYRTEHHEVMVEPNLIEALPKMAWHYEEPYGDSSALATWRLMEATKKYMTVALNGDGGDENFAGYLRYAAFSLHPWIKATPFKNLLMKSDSIAQSKLGGLTKRYNADPKQFYLNLVSYFSQKDKDFLLERKTQMSQAFSESMNTAWQLPGIDKLLALDFNTYLPGDLLPKVDIASMAFGVEARSPFLDHQLLELTATMPGNYKIKKLKTKWLLKKIAQSLLPEKVLSRPKTGFALPIKHWLKKELKNYARENLLDKSFLDYGFNQKCIEQLLAEHMAGTNNHAGRLWLLLSLNAWLKAYFK
jgi:asparagine synthase (glutamine-hydrolysing)